MAMHLMMLLPQLMLVSLVNIEALLAVSPASAVATSMAKMVAGKCERLCGNVSIPYPFGMRRPDCYFDENFLITCNHSFNPPQPFLGEQRHNKPVQEILLVDGELATKSYVIRDCYKEFEGYSKRETYIINVNLGSSSFTFSNTRNKFTVVGCDVYAYIKGSQSSKDHEYTSGCTSICNSLEDVSNYSCSGIGCCQTSIPKALTKYYVEVNSYYNHAGIMGFNPCGYAFLTEENSYNFTSADLADLQREEFVPVVVDWAIGNETCEEARGRDLIKFACKENSYCYNNNNGVGYRCNCTQGYQGNPYVSYGCQDIDECQHHLHQCEKDDYCRNTNGNYTCKCPKGHNGDGTKDGTGCSSDSPLVKIIACMGSGILLVLVCGTWLYWGLKKRKLIKLKEKFFQQNGGFILQQRLSQSKCDSSINCAAKIFSAEELRKATNNYNDNRILGQGGFGTVYKGISEDNRVIAIKKSRIIDQSQIEQFINEVVLLPQINHRNVVKLLGCCLETQIPLLVYEFINNGTLFHHIHEKTSLSWQTRLRVAAETAGAIAYLHSAASIPIIHRDIKSTNILLDDNYTAKISDFGASRLIPLDQTELTTMVQGTVGYLDPEYMQTSHLTEKSDVYSFGVLLVELLTGMKPISLERSELERNLAMCFILSMKENRLLHIIDAQVMNEASSTDHLVEVAKLAMRCLKVKGEERPTMREVAMELEGFRRIELEQNPQHHTQHPLGEPSSFYGECTSTPYSLDNEMIMPLYGGR